jgi:hypothetical protein
MENKTSIGEEVIVWVEKYWLIDKILKGEKVEEYIPVEFSSFATWLSVLRPEVPSGVWPTV